MSTPLSALTAPETVTLIRNYIPLQGPDGGPNFYEFGDDVLYEINIDNNGDGVADIIYQFQFTTTLRDPSYFLYNVGPITSLGSPNWNRVQTYSLQRIDMPEGRPTVLGTNLPCPPCNIGPLSTPNYAALAGQAVSRVGNGILSFAGQRAEGFYVDLGAIFDLGNLRPFQGDHAGWSGTGLPAMAAGVNSTDKVNVHSLALQIPISQLMPWQWQQNQSSVIGIWTTASRQKVKIYEGPSGVIFEFGAVCAGVSIGESVVQRGPDPNLIEGCMERTVTLGRQGLRPVRLGTPAGDPATEPLPGRVPQLGSVQCDTGPASRPSRNSLDRDSLNRRAGIRRQLHRGDPGGHAPPQHEHPSDATSQVQQSRPGRWRRCRLPQRPSRPRRCRHYRAASHRRGDTASR